MNQVNVLLVEDNPGDVVLIGEAIRLAGLPYRVHIVTDGVAAVEFLLRRGAYRDATRPDLIILDWNLPVRGGGDVLADIALIPDVRRIPLMVLSSSLFEGTAIRAFNLPDDSYVTKPSTFTGYRDLVRTIEAFRQRAFAALAREEPRA